MNYAGIPDATIDGRGLMTGAQVAALVQSVGQNTSDVTLGTANGLSLIAQVLSMGAASALAAGAVTAGAQSFGGQKTFSDGLTVPINTAIDLNGAGGNANLKFRSADGLMGFTNNAAAFLGIYLGTGAAAASGKFSAANFEVLASSRSINVPSLVLPGGSGGFGYGGALELGGAFNVINHDGSRMFMQAFGSGVSAEVQSFYSTAVLSGFVGANPGSTDVVTKIGTRTATGSVDDSARLMSVRSGIGGTEFEHFSVRKGGVLNSTTLIEAPAVANAVHMTMVGGGAGWSGLHMHNSASGIGRLIFGGYGTVSGVMAENGPLGLEQNGNAYRSDALMRFTIQGPASVASDVPCFDFTTLTALQSGQALTRWKVNGVEVLRVDAAGALTSSGGSSNVTISESLLKLRRGGASVSLNEGGGGGAQIYTTTVGYSGVEVTSGGVVNLYSTNAVKAFIDATGDLEFTTADHGVILKSANGTRRRVTLSDAGALVVSAAL